MSSVIARSILRALHALTEPVFAPIRRIIPALGGLDISPLIVLLLLTFFLSMLTFGTGRTNVLFGLVHMVVFAVYVFMVFVP